MPNPTQRFAAPLALGVMLVTALVFAGGLGGGFVYDDYYLIETNPALASPGSLATYLRTPLFPESNPSGLYQWVTTGTQYWRPFVKLAFLVQYRLFGLAPLGWHALSLALHLACVLLAFVWIRRRIEPATDAARTALELAAALAALFFAVHPSRVEAVAWISGSADLWMGFWVLLGLVAWERSTRGSAVLAGLSFALAFLSKETALVVPVCLAIDLAAKRLPATPDPRPRKSAAPPPRHPHVVRWIVASLPLLGAIVLRLALLPVPMAEHAGSPLVVLARGVACLGLYVGQIVWPVHPSTQIGFIAPDLTFEVPRWSVVVGAVTLAGVVVLAWRARRHPTARPWFADVVWVVLPLVPVLQFVPVGYTALAAERFLYLPLLGVAALVGRVSLLALAGRTAPEPALAPRRTLGVFVAGLALCLLMIVPTLRVLPAFRSTAALWSYEVTLQPDNPFLHLYKSRAERQQGRLGEALDAARASYEHALTDDQHAEAAVEAAMIRLEMLASPGPESERLREFLDAVATGGAPVGSTITLEAPGGQMTVRITREFRDRIEATAPFHSARAVANAQAGRYRVAAAEFEALAKYDRAAPTYANLARAQACAERWDDALRTLAQGEQLYPRDPQLGALETLVAEGRSLAAAPASERASQAVKWAQLWLDLGAPSLIRRELEPVATDPQAVAYLALADALDGNVSGALERLAAARAQDPAHAALWNAAQAEVTRMASPQAPSKPSGVDALFR